MKKLLLTLIAALSVIGINAKSMTQVWASIPNALVPYIDPNHRLEMTDFIGMGLKGDVDNVMGSKSVMDTITNNFIQVKLSEAATLQIKRLPYTDGDSILCVVQTWSAPEGESYVTFYNQNWEPIDIKLSPKDYTAQMITIPDSLVYSSDSSLIDDIDFTMVKANLSPANDDLTLSLSIPSKDKDTAKKLKALTKDLILKWDNNSYHL